MGLSLDGSTIDKRKKFSNIEKKTVGEVIGWA